MRNWDYLVSSGKYFYRKFLSETNCVGKVRMDWVGKKTRSREIGWIVSQSKRSTGSGGPGGGTGDGAHKSEAHSQSVGSPAP